MRVDCRLGVLALLLGLVCVPATLGEHDGETSSWTNRSPKVWAENAKTTPVNVATFTNRRLPWRPTEVPAEASLAAADDDFAGDTTNEARYGASWVFAEANAAARPLDQVKMKRLAQMHLQRDGQMRNSAAPQVAGSNAFVHPFGDDVPPQSPLDDPFVDQPGRAERVAGSAPPTPFADPFADTVSPSHHEAVRFVIETADDAYETVQPPRFQLANDESNRNVEMRQPENQRLKITVGAPMRRDKPLEMHKPLVAFQPPEELRLDDLSEPSEPPVEEIPEFSPLDDDLRSEPPTPESVPGNRDLPQLPDLPEPGRAGDSGRLEPDLDEQGNRRMPELERPRSLRDDEPETPFEDVEEELQEENADRGDRLKTPCGRIYNDRNCCEEDNLCEFAWNRLQSTTIKDISVSIAPPLVPLAEDEQEIEEQRERLRRSPIRDWRNRNNTIVVTGRLEDLVDSAVVIRAEDGRTQRIAFYDLNQDDLCFVTAWWRLPTECLVAADEYQLRDFTLTTFTWKASGVCHKPLYFEQVELERYGHSAGPILQPLLSGAHFFASCLILPYNMGLYTPNECRYVLGYYRPGSCAPWLVPGFPLSRRAAAYQTTAVLGLWGVF